jgi:hypothetical protein
VGKYAPKHNPFVYFDDVTNINNVNSAYCIAHVRPFAEMATDLQNNTVAQYVFITPNLCDDGHDSCAPVNDAVRQTDNWLAANVPPILNSTAYQNGGALFITWDEGSGNDGPIGMIVLSPFAKGGGYSNTIHYTHGSLLRTVETIFGVSLLGDAAAQTDLSDLFGTPAPGSTGEHKCDCAKWPGRSVMDSIGRRSQLQRETLASERWTLRGRHKRDHYQLHGHRSHQRNDLLLRGDGFEYVWREQQFAADERNAQSRRRRPDQSDEPGNQQVGLTGPRLLGAVSYSLKRGTIMALMAQSRPGQRDDTPITQCQRNHILLCCNRCERKRRKLQFKSALLLRLRPSS